MEMRFFAPGSLVSNLDFVEGIFGNGGDPYLPENDAALDVLHWTGHTGCVILAPHLVGIRKKDLGLPHCDEATERQRRDGMCWTDEDEPYNDGGAFKITCRDHRGVMVTIIADNYYGYCKKEVKTQISFAANLYGMCEEEHAGGAIAFPTLRPRAGVLRATARSLSRRRRSTKRCALLGDLVEIKPEGYARRHANIPTSIYVPGRRGVQRARGIRQVDSRRRSRRDLTLRAGHDLCSALGLQDPPREAAGGHGVAAGRLASRTARCATSLARCPAAASPRSPSRSRTSMLKGPVFVTRLSRRHGRRLQTSSKKDYSTIYKSQRRTTRASRPILSPERSLGSVIKLLTPSTDYTDEHNEWIESLPQTIRQLVFTIKRYYRPEWGDNWREHFTVDRINGVPRPRAEIRQPEAGRQLSARGLRPGRLLADLQTPPGLPSGRQGAGGGRHHRLRRAAARRA